MLAYMRICSARCEVAILTARQRCFAMLVNLSFDADLLNFMISQDLDSITPFDRVLSSVVPH